MGAGEVTELAPGDVRLTMSTFVGFGFGAIQGGLFLPEAFASGFFNRLVVSEIDAGNSGQGEGSGGTYFCNIAHLTRLRKIGGD